MELIANTPKPPYYAVIFTSHRSEGDAEYGEILGVHIVGPEASELIAEAVFAMQAEATHEDIASCVHAHPTRSEAIMEAALAVEGRSINF